LKHLNPVTDHELTCEDNDHRDEKEREMRYSEDKLMRIWTEKFCEEFFELNDREASTEEIDLAWDRLDFDRWASEWLAENP
jgi:hypothetical protein